MPTNPLTQNHLRATNAGQFPSQNIFFFPFSHIDTVVQIDIHPEARAYKAYEEA
jgi:hypothetical protein